METPKKTIKYLTTLENKKYGYYGQQQFAKDSATIQLIEFLDKQFKKVTPAVYEKIVDLFENEDADPGITLRDRYKIVSADNAYNFNGPIVFQFVKYEDLQKDIKYLLIRFHIAGDVRGNYTDPLVLEGTDMDFDEFYSYQIDIPCLDDDRWSISQYLFDEESHYSVYDYQEDDDVDCDEYPWQVQLAIECFNPYYEYMEMYRVLEKFYSEFYKTNNKSIQKVISSFLVDFVSSPILEKDRLKLTNDYSLETFYANSAKTDVKIQALYKGALDIFCHYDYRVYSVDKIKNPERANYFGEGLKMYIERVIIQHASEPFAEKQPEIQKFLGKYAKHDLEGYAYFDITDDIMLMLAWTEGTDGRTYPNEFLWHDNDKDYLLEVSLRKNKGETFKDDNPYLNEGCAMALDETDMLDGFEKASRIIVNWLQDYANNKTNSK